MRLKGKSALVTGAGSGIGKCIAETYVREGARVALADINAEAAKSAARVIGNNAIAFRCDVRKKADVAGVIEETLAAFGALDILVNNAGATHVNKPMLAIDEEEYDRIFAVNVKGVFLACRRCRRISPMRRCSSPRPTPNSSPARLWKSTGAAASSSVCSIGDNLF
jgi:3-oxoacyl-[acyl-carrier protein] reductase